VWDERLTPPEIPERWHYIWKWFWQIIGGKGEQGFWVTLQAWESTTRNRLTMFEVDQLWQMNTEYENAMHKRLREG